VEPHDSPFRSGSISSPVYLSVPPVKPLQLDRCRVVSVAYLISRLFRLVTIGIPDVVLGIVDEFE